MTKKYLLFLLLIIPSFYLAFSRGAICCSFLILFFTFYLNKRYKFIIITLVTFIPIYFIFYFSGEEIQYLIIDTPRFENTSSLGHLIEWIEGILSIIENPFGVGLAMSGNANSRLINQLRLEGENPVSNFWCSNGNINYDTLHVNFI